jgi:hypothetical protein
MTRLNMHYEKQKDVNDQEKKPRAIMVSYYTAMMNASQIKSKPERRKKKRQSMKKGRICFKHHQRKQEKSHAPALTAK